MINTLGDNALFEAFLARQHEVDAVLMAAVADNLAVALQASSAAAATTEATRRGDPSKRLDLATVDELLQGLQRR